MRPAWCWKNSSERTDRLTADHNHNGMVPFEEVILGPRRLAVIAHPSRPRDKVPTSNDLERQNV